MAYATPLSAYLDQRTANERESLGNIQQAGALQTLLAQAGASQREAKAREIMASNATPDEKFNALSQVSPQHAHQFATGLKEMQAAKAQQSLQGMKINDLLDNPQAELAAVTANPRLEPMIKEARKVRENNAALASMRRTKGEDGTLAGGHFSSLIDSEIPAIANQARTAQSQLDLPNSAIPATHWVDLQKQLAAQESGILERRTAAKTALAAKSPENAGLSEQYATDPTYKKNVDYWATLLSNGGTLPPRFAQSGSGKKMMPDILNVVPTLGSGNSRDMLANQVDLTGQKSEARSVGTRSAAVSMAAGEAREMMPILQQTSENFARTGYQPINMVFKAFQDKTGSVESRQFGAALNSFVNVYARAVSPSGVPTVSDKDHAREILSTADSHPQLMGLLKVLDQEMVAAQNAPRRVREAQRAGIAGGKEAPPHTATLATTVPEKNAQGWALHVDANGNKAYVSPDGKSFEEVK